MYACIILHNMIMKDERDQYEGNYDYEGIEGVRVPTMDDVNGGAPPLLATDILQINADIHNRRMHHQLQHDLVEYILQKYGEN